MGETGGEPRISAPGPLGDWAEPSRASERASKSPRGHRVARPLRGITIASGVASAAGASLAGYPRVAVGAFVLAALTGLTVIGELWVGKLRDDSFGRIAGRPDADPVILREFTIRDAVRARLLSSEDAARILGSRAEGDPPRYKKRR